MGRSLEADREEPSEPSLKERDVDLPDEEIAILAHEIWVQLGRPENSAEEVWFAARNELKNLKEQAQRLAQQQSGEIHQLLQAIFDNPRAVIFVKDALGRYLIVNKSFEEQWAGGRTPVAGNSDYELFPPATAATLRVNDLKILSKAGPWEFDETIPHATGVKTWRSIRFPLIGAGDLPYAVCGIAVDVSQQKLRQMHWEMACAVTQALAGYPTLDGAAPKLLQTICEALGWPVGALWVVNDQRSSLHCEELWHNPRLDISEFIRVSRDLRLAKGEGIPGHVWAAQEPLWFTNLPNNPSLSRWRTFEDEELQAAIAFPVRNGGEIIGILEFFSRQVQQPDPDLLTLMANVGSQISQYLHRGQAEKALLQRDREFQLARQIQQGLLPVTPPQVPGFEIAGASVPAQETGGDYFDYFVLDNGCVIVAVGDAAGHGIGAALLITEVSSFIRALALTQKDLGEILDLTNQHFVQNTEAGYFVTFFLARLDPQNRSLVYSSAGHPPGYVLDSKGRTKAVLHSTGMPLGLFAEAEFPASAEMTLDLGELLILYTDGIVEANDAHGQLFGIERVVDIVRHGVTSKPEETIDRVMTAVTHFATGEQRDDMTVVCLKCLTDRE